jgi:hypothetical protein
LNTLEITLIGAALLPLALSRDAWAFARRVPAAALFCTLLFFALLLAGHLAAAPSRTFPFVTWWMYGLPKRDVIEFERYVGVTALGREEHLIPGALFPSLGRGTFRLANPLRDAVRSAAAHPDNRARAEALLVALAQARNRTNPRDPVRLVRVVHCALPVRDWKPDAPFDCCQLLSVDVAEGDVR